MSSGLRRTAQMCPCDLNRVYLTANSSELTMEISSLVLPTRFCQPAILVDVLISIDSK
jgi:hypothetical protein